MIPQFKCKFESQLHNYAIDHRSPHGDVSLVQVRGFPLMSSHDSTDCRLHRSPSTISSITLVCSVSPSHCARQHSSRLLFLKSSAEWPASRKDQGPSRGLLVPNEIWLTPRALLAHVILVSGLSREHLSALSASRRTHVTPHDTPGRCGER